MTMKEVFKYWPAALTLVLGLGAWYFWAVPYLSALAYQEQYQLFLATAGYFAERMAVPGGLMDYVGEWLTQWNHYRYVGSLFVAAVLVVLQVFTWLVARKAAAARKTALTPCHYPLTFLPVLFLWGYMGDENVMLSFALSLAAALALMLAYEHSKVRWVRWAFFAVALPLAYWLIGPAVGITLVFALGYEQLRERSLVRLGASIGLMVWLCFIILALSYVVAYPYDRLFIGINYYRYPVYNPAMQLTALALFAVVPLLVAKLPALRFAALAETVVLAVGGWCWVRACFDPKTYELLDYDYLLRTEQWDKIIDKAEHKQASLPMSVCIVNLALSEQGQLADRLFDFYQHDGSGLIPEFALNMVTPIAPAEVYYRLGMVNECERYMFEAQEAIPNYRKSGRLTQRIIDCQIVNGQYALARKQLHLLAGSPVYREWAESRLAMLGNEQAINGDPVYGRLRQLRQRKQDFLYSDKEIDQMLGLLFMQNKTNKMAYEYLVCYDLLQGDLDHFMRYYALGRYIDYDHIPRPFQEVLIGNWIQRHGGLQGLPYSVDRTTVQNTVDFIQTYQANASDPRLDQYPLATNAWNYLLRSDKKEERKASNRNIY